MLSDQQIEPEQKTNVELGCLGSIELENQLLKLFCKEKFQTEENKVLIKGITALTWAQAHCISLVSTAPLWLGHG